MEKDIDDAIWAAYEKAKQEKNEIVVQLLAEQYPAIAYQIDYDRMIDSVLRKLITKNKKKVKEETDWKHKFKQWRFRWLRR